MNFNDYKNVAVEINNVYQQMDIDNEKFSKKFNIKCVSTCNGNCCSKVDVEVSPVDLIPLVLNLIDQNKAEAILVDLFARINDHCLFYSNGRCSIYNDRATLCRLFGNTAIFDKMHQNNLSICREIANQYSHPIAKANANQAPNLVIYTQKINNLVPSWDSTPRSFNKALLYAINKIYTAYLYS